MTADEDDIFDNETRLESNELVLAGRYRVVRELGRGAMGTVYLAKDTMLDGFEVALKMLPAVLGRDKRALQSLKQEALLARKLSHPHIVTLRHFEEAESGVFLVMDYVQGKTLADVLADHGPMTDKRVRAGFRSLASALDYAHRRGVVHRDIKPSNILVARDGTPLLADFGIARELKESLTRLTGRSTSGTLPYMSPEQLLGAEPAPAQDIYSLAATMYECLAGHPPFHRGEIAHQIETLEPPPPVTPVTPLAASILRGLAKQPSGRPQTCKEW